MKILIFLILSLTTLKAFSQVSTSSAPPSGDIPQASAPKINYEYKKDEYFDFEALSVKGELLSPGDLSTKSNRRVKFQLKKYIRKNFDDYITDDLLEVY